MKPIDITILLLQLLNTSLNTLNTSHLLDTLDR